MYLYIHHSTAAAEAAVSTCIYLYLILRRVYPLVFIRICPYLSVSIRINFERICMLIDTRIYPYLFWGSRIYSDLLVSVVQKIDTRIKYLLYLCGIPRHLKNTRETARFFFWKRDTRRKKTYFFEGAMFVRVVVSLVCGSSHSIPSPSFNTCLSLFTTRRTRGAHVTEARFEKLIDICGVASVCSVWVSMLSLPEGSQHIPPQGFLVNNAAPHVRSGRPSLVKSCAHTNSDWSWRAH